MTEGASPDGRQPPADREPDAVPPRPLYRTLVGNGRAAMAWASRPFGLFQDPELRESGRWILYSGVIGIVSGIGAILFDLAFRLSQRLLLGGIGGFQPPGAGSEGGPGHAPELIWLLPLSLVVGGLISGALVFGLCPEAEGHGTDAVIRSFHHLRGRIRYRVPLVKALSSAITIGAGGSAGREGPIAQIGAGFGSILGDILALRNQDRRIMMMAGCAGGIASIFRAPLGAALFAAEVLYSEPEFEYKALLPGLISGITGYSIYSSYAGWGFLFTVPPVAFHEVGHIPFYIALGVVCAAVGVIYPTVFYGTRDRIFRRLPVPRWTKPAIGAAALGAIALLFPPALGMGYGYIQEAIRGEHTTAFLLTFAAVKILATSLTISSGGSGGVFGPSLVIGGAVGAAFGQMALSLFPGSAPPPVACLMVGMGGFFAGVAKVPFASVIMVMEMTGSYGLLVPSLLVATIAYLVLPLRVSLYENQVPRRTDSPAHLGSFAIDVLRAGRVGGSFVPPRVVTGAMPGTRLGELMELFDGAPELLPVLDAEGNAVGEVSIEDVRRAMLSEVPRDLVVALDVMRPVTEWLTPDDDLAAAARVLSSREPGAVLVMRDAEDRRPMGTFTRRDLIVAYGRELSRPGEDEPEPPLHG